MNPRLPAILLSLGAGALVTLAAAGPPGASPPPGPPPGPPPTTATAAPAPAAAPVPPASAAPAAPVPPAALPAAQGGVREIELPVDTGSYRQGPGVELAQAFCLTCHSVEYCETQPFSAEKYWAATVKKMKEKFGAPLPEEVIAPLTKYLTATYGKPTP